MADVRDLQKKDDSDYERPLVAELCRMIWLAFGPAGLIFAGAAISKNPKGSYAAIDVAFWGIAVLVITSRFLDIRFFRGRTTENEHATLSDWWRYSLKLGLFAVAVWLLAHWAQG